MIHRMLKEKYALSGSLLIWSPPMAKRSDSDLHLALRLLGREPAGKDGVV